MASDLTRLDAAPASRPPPPSAQPHRTRFLVIYALLALAIGAAIAGVVVFAGRSINPAPKWSSWKPSGGGLGAAQQIADRVSGTYHLPGGGQLVDVIAKSPSFSSSPSKTVQVSFIAVRGTRGNVDQVQEVSPSNSVWYSLCGLGDSCSIATGKPSQSRGTLVRREILELALYTFKYVKGVQHVVAFMPPRKARVAPTIVYLQKSDVAAELNRPLTATLPPKVPLPATISAREQQAIDTTTESRLYTIFSLPQTQQGDVALVLRPIPHQAP